MNQHNLPTRNNRVRFSCRAVSWLLAGMVMACATGQAQAQGTGAKKAPEKIFEEHTLETRDGILLRCTYYPGPEKKTTVPLILLHDWDGNRVEFHDLAVFLSQNLLHSVIVPDLRGHGSSLRRKGLDEDLDRSRFNRLAVEAMALDVEAAKTFLLQRNNEEKVNIEQLGVLGCGFGATLALKWAVRDWNVQNLPTYKMGQDVKALILISPEYQTQKGVNVAKELRDVRTLSQLSTLIAVGKQDSGRLSEARRIHNSMEKARLDDHEAALPFYPAETSLQGMKLIYARGLDVPRSIALFLDQRLVQRANLFPWTDRTSPLR